MIIKRLVLKNIRSYTRCNIEFPSGKLILSGDIGAGKSTILYAIEFALFGIMKGMISGPGLLRNGSTQGSVELHFECGGKEYIIKRTIKRKSKATSQENGYIISEGVKYDLSPVELKSRILEILGYPKDFLTRHKSLIFRYSVYTPQEEMRQIIYMNSEDRRTILRGIFQLEKYSLIKENSQKFSKHLREKRKLLEGSFQDLDAKQKRLKELEDELKSLQKELSSSKEQLERLAKQKKEVDEKENRLKNIQEQLQKNQELLEQSKDSLNLAQKKLSELLLSKKEYLRELEALKSEIENEEKTIQNEQEIKDLLSKKEEYLNDYNYKKNIFKKNTQDLAKLNEELSLVKKSKEVTSEKVAKITTLCEKATSELMDQSAIKSELERLNLERDSLVSQISSLTEAIANSESFVQKLDTLKECPTCKQRVDSLHKSQIKNEETEKQLLLKESLEKARAQIKLIESDILKFSNELKLQSEKAYLVESLKNQKSILASQIEEKENQIEEILKRVAEIKAENESLPELASIDTEKEKEAIIQLKSQLETIQKLKLKKEQLKSKSSSVSQIESSISYILESKKSFEEKITLYSKEIEKAKIVQTELLSQKALFDSIKLKYEEAKKNELLSRSRIEMATKMTEELRKEVSQKLSNKEKSTKLVLLEDYFSKTLPNLSELIEAHLFGSILKDFKEHFEGWFSGLIDSEALYATIDDTFSPIITIDGYETDISSLSGGEKTCVALAYRLALNKVINDVVSSINTKELLILDEPTDGFSSEQLDRVRDVLDSLGLKQIIIVSHEAKMESFVDSIIRIAKNESESQIVSL